MIKCPHYQGVRIKRVNFNKRKYMSFLVVGTKKTVRCKRASVERGFTVFLEDLILRI